ncbi:hypothetical protein CPC08DRAFT_763823 [Agrocybe pediades]|nr:hypothetical protein CPC08DRAFT_763823 [Agrocybe pediades]
MENVDFPEDITVWRPTYTRPLITARHCSQVCQQWRNIFLSSSSIWAKMIDVDSLEQKTDKWREEVVSRAGQVPLWVYGRVQRGMVDFVGQFLKNNWPRIQAVGICELSLTTLSLREHREMWACLSRPAPNLRRMDILISDSYQRTVLLGPLFGNDAPALKELQIASSTYKFEKTASWIRNLSAVTFYKSFSTKEMLEALEYMPQLMHLKVAMEETSDPNHPTMESENSVIHMPNLKMMELDGYLRGITAVLTNITPSSDCCLSIMLDSDDSSFDMEEYRQYEKASTKYFVSYFSLHRPTALRVEFPLNCSAILADGAPTDGRCFAIPIFGDLVPDSVKFSAIPEQLVKAGSLSSVEELKIGQWCDGAFALDDTETFTRLADMNIFSPVTILTAIDEVLDLFLTQASLKEGFPNLTVLKIVPDEIEWEHWYSFPTDQSPAYHRFLKHRKAIGLPISVLEIHLDALENVDYLEEHTGLVVRSFYRHQYLGEYRCGDGHPERLRFGTTKKR